jgi:hypothetical protein
MPNISAFKEIYDWFYRTYGETSRERLMKNAVGIQHLKLSQPWRNFTVKAWLTQQWVPTASSNAVSGPLSVPSGFAPSTERRRVVRVLFALFCRNVLLAPFLLVGVLSVETLRCLSLAPDVNAVSLISISRFTVACGVARARASRAKAM